MKNKSQFPKFSNQKKSEANPYEVSSFSLKKMSIEDSRKILCTNGESYSDSEIEFIREFMYTMATIHFLFISRNQKDSQQ